MAKYMVIYGGGGEPSPEKFDKIMEEWSGWYEKMGSAIVDGGSPFAASKHFTDEGPGDGPLGEPTIVGYTIISADSLEAAAEACADHPHLEHGGVVQVFETMDMSARS